VFLYQDMSNLPNTKQNDGKYDFIRHTMNNLNTLTVHFTCVILSMILYTFWSIPLEIIINLTKISFMFLIPLFCVLFVVCLYKITRIQDSLKHRLRKFWNLCIRLSLINYRLIKEYRQIYNYHYGNLTKECVGRKIKYGTNGQQNKDIFSQIHNDEHDNEGNPQNKEIEECVEYITHHDPENRMEKYEWIKNIINKINKYVQLCYYLTFINQSDELKIKQNIVYVNIKTDSLLNKRNRKLELLLNKIQNEYKNELVQIWDIVDKQKSDKVLSLVPCKWIVNEYRILFRYLYNAKYFKNVYSSFKDDFNNVENIVYELSTTVRELFGHTDFDFPYSITKLFDIVSLCLGLIFDNFIVCYMMSYFHTVGISIMILPLLLLVNTCFNYVLSNITNVTKNLMETVCVTENGDKDIDDKLEITFNEMNIMMLDDNN
jgi:hypothetical protein